tara:strand:+ start:2874 stop:3086 length:213 start_codon:yes stop_codon:yes gene_type:complete
MPTQPGLLGKIMIKIIIKNYSAAFENTFKLSEKLVFEHFPVIFEKKTEVHLCAPQHVEKSREQDEKTAAR